MYVSYNINSNKSSRKLHHTGLGTKVMPGIKFTLPY